MTKITIGPVIGKVTKDTARVAVEVDSRADVTCVATDSAGNSVTDQKQLDKGRFKAFQLTGLSPETEYGVSFQGAECSVDGMFRTYAESPTRMTIGAVSCNSTKEDDDTDLWADLRDRYVNPGKLDLLIHAGDQIYGDGAFQRAKNLLGDRKEGTVAQREKIKEFYRKLYRRAWGEETSTREVLARVPNLMIWDDHDIRDDWGGRENDRNPNSRGFHVGTLARDVFREYQRQLYQDPVDWPADGFEDHRHIWGPIGVLFVDQRGGRSFARDRERPYLGAPQWQRIAGDLGRGGYFDEVRALIVVTSVPLVYLGAAITNRGEDWFNDLGDHWAYGVHRKEQIEMLRRLRYWLWDGPKRLERGRELLVVGGDVHIGCKTDIRHDGETIFRQLITSPVSNRPPGMFEYGGMLLALEAEQNLSSRYSFEHEDYTRRRNFGIIKVRVPSDNTKKPMVDGGLEFS